MRKPWNIVIGLIVGVSAVVRPAAAQSASVRSHSSGLFVGLGLEGDGVSSHVAQSDIWTKETGGGGGLVLGYGFSSRWSLYSELSDASIDQDGGGKYALRHFDVGARIHFRAGPNAVVPFVQLGFSGRSMVQHFPTFPGTSTTVSTSGGPDLGGGLNIHLTPAFAFSGSATWTIGTFRNPGVYWNATSARVHLGVLWFPGA